MDDYEVIWKKVKNNLNLIGVDLILGKRFIIETNRQYNLWFLINSILFFIIIIANFVLLDFWIAILINIIYLILYFIITGYSSYKPNKASNYLWLISLGCIAIYLIFPEVNIISILLILAHLFSINIFYGNILNKIIEMVLNDFNMFKELLILNIVFIKNI